MLELLNKFAWFVCIAVSFALSAAFFGREMYDWWIVFATIISLLLKWLVFPKDYILTRLHFFKNQIQSGSWVAKDDVFQEKVTQDGDMKEVENWESTYLDTHTSQEDVSNIAQRKSEVRQQTTYSTADNSPSTPGIIETFFSQNFIGRIWGIILFIWVLVFLSAVYPLIGPVAKIVIWFIIGWSIYAGGIFLDNKWYINESRITLWVWILVNYLVILSGRFILWDDAGILTVGTTFLFLILNTVFAVVTALVYNSRTLLIFSFVFAYLNPFLLGTNSPEPYTLLGYTMIVTLGAMFMSYTKKDEILFPASFTLAGIIFLIAPYPDSNAWISKLLCINTLWVMWLYVSTNFKKTYEHIFELMIAGVFFLIGIMWLLALDTGINIYQIALMWVSSIGLMFLSFLKAKKSPWMYSVWTLATIISLSPVIVSAGLNQWNVGVCVSIVIVFTLINIWFVALRGNKYLRDNLTNIVTGLLTGSLFLSGMLFFYGNEFFPGVSLGFGYLWLAGIYAMLAFYMTSKIGIPNMKEDERYANVFYTISAIAVSLFTLAVALVFSNSPEIISIVWMLEATVLLYLYTKVSSPKIAAWFIALFIIWTMSVWSLVNLNNSWDYWLLVTFWVIIVCLVLNLFLLYKRVPTSSTSGKDLYVVHDIVHIIAMVIALTWSYFTININDVWISLLYCSLAMSALWYLYSFFSSWILKIVHLLAYIFFLFIHICIFVVALLTWETNIILSTIIAWVYALPFIWEFMQSGRLQSKKLVSAFALYIFLLTTLYVLDIFEVTFAVTMYWGLLSFLFLRQWINSDTIWMRTIWLYLLTLTVWKIFFYDLWQSGVDDGVWFIVFIATWILMIAMSTMYTKKYGNNLNREFNISNVFPKDDAKTNKNSSSQKDRKNERWDIVHAQKIDSKSKIQKDIESINISDISSINLHFTDSDTPVSIRAENLLKISKLICNTYKKKTFKPWELQQAYDKIESNYKSTLSPAQYTKIRKLIKRFVDVGWKIEFVKK